MWGETNAGKSTFINAILGDVILPTNKLQCTSSAIEITDSINKSLTITYADERKVEYTELNGEKGIDDIDVKLLDIATLDTKYIGIPTKLIDSLIINKRINQNEFTNRSFFKKLLEKIKLVKNPLFKVIQNEYESDFSEMKEKILKYVKNHPRECIPVKIELGIPLRPELKHIKFIDTPGFSSVASFSGIYELTSEADTIIFVSTISDFEKSTFLKFIDYYVSENSQNSIICVLTKSGYTSDLKPIVNRALLNLGGVFDSNRIIPIDSILKLIVDDLKQHETVAKLKTYYNTQIRYFQDSQVQENSNQIGIIEEKSNLLHVVLNKMKVAQNDSVSNDLLEQSNFDLLVKTIDENAKKAPIIKSMNIVNKIKHGYETQTSDLKNKISKLSSKIKSTDELSNKIIQVQTNLDEIHLLRNRLLNNQKDLKSIKSKLNYRQKKFTKDLNIKAKELSKEKSDESVINDCFCVLTEILTNDINNCIEECLSNIRNTYKEKLLELGIEISDGFVYNKQKISMKKILVNSKESALKEQEKYINERGMFKKARDVIFRNFKDGIFQKKLIEFIKEGSNEVIQSMIEKIYNDELKVYISEFTAEIEIQIQNESKGLKGLEKRLDTYQKNNEELKNCIKEMEIIQSNIELELSKIAELIDQYKEIHASSTD